MNSLNRSSSNMIEQLNFQPNNSNDDSTGDVELAMDCGSSTSGSDHCYSTARKERSQPKKCISPAKNMCPQLFDSGVLRVSQYVPPGPCSRASDC